MKMKSYKIDVTFANGEQCIVPLRSSKNENYLKEVYSKMFNVSNVIVERV